MTYKWTAVRPTMTINEPGGTDIKSTLIVARDHIHADPILRDIFSEAFSLQVFDEEGKQVYDDNQLTLHKLNDMTGV